MSPTVTPPTPPAPPVPPAPPAPAPAPAPPVPPTRRRNTLFNVIMWAAIVVGLLSIGTMIAGIALKPSSTPPVPTKPVVVRKAAPAKKAVVKTAAPAPSLVQSAPSVLMPTGSRINVDISTPGGSRVKVNVEEGLPVVPLPTSPTPPVPPVPQPTPAPSVQTPVPAPMPTPPPPVVQPQVQPPVVAPQAPFQAPSGPAPQDIQAISARQPAKVVNVLSGNTFQFRVEVASRWGGANYGYGYYGSTYGWTPGHEELRYDPRTGTYYRVWVSHPQPGYYSSLLR